MSGDPSFCQCPSSWLGTVPPVCPVHNPQTFTYPTTTATATAVGYGAYSSGAGWLMSGLSDADVERIAKRVVELLKEQPK